MLIHNVSALGGGKNVPEDTMEDTTASKHTTLVYPYSDIPETKKTTKKEGSSLDSECWQSVFLSKSGSNFEARCFRLGGIGMIHG